MKRFLIGCFAALAALATKSEEPFAAFVKAESGESAAVRLENRTNATVVARVVTGVMPTISPAGIESTAWDTAKMANGWQEVKADGEDTVATQLLVLNAPDYKVEGGRFTASTTWTSDSVHWVRNWVIVPSGVTLTVKEGTIVKFGEQTGIKVENGGTVDFQGKSDSRIVLTHFADDVYGGDSDFGKTNAWYGAWSVTAVSGGTVNDVYAHVRYGMVGTLPTISMPASVTAQRIEGKARIPVTFSEARADRMTLHWRAIDGTATFGTDYAKQEGEEVWSNSAEATQYFTIPLLESDDEEVKTFRIELVSVEDCNPNPTRLETTVTIISGKSVPIAVSAESAESAAVRLESRPETMVGRALVCGTEWKSANGESCAETWDTTPLGHGWHSLTATAGGDGVSPSQARILALNDAKIAVEGGRLTADTKWDNGAVHVVRNQVVVPSGVTLTIGEGTVVKFAEVTGIKVEDGGAVNLEGKSAARVVLTSLADDAFGGDTDLIETNGVYGSWSIAAVGSGAISDAYTYVRYGTIPSLPTLTMPASATAQRSEGKVRIPITLNGTRSNRMAIHWRTHDGTAKHGVDFTETEGEATWSNASSTTVYLEIPLITESDADGVKTFEVEVVSAEDINLDPSRLVTKVIIVTGSLVPIPTCAVSESSEAVRLEARTEGMVGKAAVVGTEWKAADGESRAEEWDTTPLGYGWQTLDDGKGNDAEVLALNDGKISVEGGRLTANAAWNSNVIHVVRNTVIVPNGVTLSVTTNAVVKFCENTGIRVEEGGSLIVVGSTNEPAVFTTVTDDTTGGDTDAQERVPPEDSYRIDIVSGGTFTDRNAAFRHVVMSNHATLSLPTECEINESEKQVQIPVSVSGSRSTPFRVFWRAIDDTAKYPDDYPIREGVVEWASTSDGTRFITVPVNDDGEEEETERFKIELYDAQGANVSRTAFACTVTVRDSTATLVPVAVAAESEASAAVRLENRPEGTLGKAAVVGVEWKAVNGDSRAEEWNTVPLGHGWQTLTAEAVREGADSTVTAEVLTLNNDKVAVEGGRLETTTIWDSNAVHLVRNMVIVPSGVTLSVTTNAVVKFCENTGIKVEAGGRFQLLGSLDENVYMTLANDDTVGGDTDKDEEREWVEGAATYSVDVVSGGTFTDMNSVIRGTTIGTFGSASVNAKTVIDAAEGVIRIPVFVNGSRTTQFSVDWKTSDGLRGQLIWGNVNEGTKWVTLNVADCSEKFTFELCECRGINIDGAAKVSEVSVFRNTTPLAISAESESSAAVRFENRADGTFGKALCFGTELKSADGDSRAEAWDTTLEENDWIDLGEGMKLLVRNDHDLAVEGGRLMPTYRVINTNGVEVTNWNYSVNWTSDKIHIVRNWVVVPNGMTLSIAAGTVVKFAEFTGFKVEAGGRLYVEGTVDAPVVYTAAADDTIGGDTDKREVEPQYGDYAIDVLSGGMYNDRNCAIRYATFSNLGTATLPASAVANEKDGVVRVPIFIDTSRTTAFCVDWRVASGAYATKGRLNWNTYTEGTKYIEIPLTPGTVKGDFDTFEIEMYESQGINVSTTERKCVVTIYPDKKFPEEIAFADSDDSAAVRMENRDPLWSYGAEIVCGTELKSANGDSRAEPWDTTQENEGWVEVTDGSEKLQLLVRNDESVAVEGGRMEASTVWTKDVVHIVRNWVVVPNGVTLTIAAGTVVKFCDETGIKVEAGGRLVSAGTAAADVILTSINDDTVGGDTDFDEVEPEHGDYWINVVSGGTFTDTYTQMRYGESGTFGSVSIPEEVIAKKDGGIVRIPLTISASRTTPFSVDWVAHDGTAIYGEDYLCASGRIDWTSSAQGTRYLEIPLDRMAPTAEDEKFYIELTTGLGINLNLASTLCEVGLYDSRESLVGGSNGYAESSWATPIEVDGLAGSTYPLFAQPEEIISYSTLWSTNGVDGASVKVTHEDMEGNVCDFLDETGRVEGQTKWKVGDDAYGRYRFRHQVLDEDGKQLEIQSQDFIVSDVIEHGGAIRADETWDAGHVHVVRETVTVLRGATLTIEPGAIVKFFPGTGITTQDDGECIANGAQFTHVADDQLGGDTFFDGGITTPGLGEYTLSGNVRTDVGTETRYAKAQVVSANISTDTTWGSHTVYHITKSITIVKPAVLTIQAGAVVKLADGVRITVNSGATLDVQGTRAAPVVFTSIKDDEFGGDSNQDGTATAPKNGIWDEILNSGTLRMSYAHVLYGGYGQYSNQGDAAIRNTGGTATLDCCVVEGSDLRLLGLSGGTMTVRNSVLRDGRWGWEGNVTFVNGVVENCTTGASGGKATNAIFWNCPTAMSGTTQKNCVAFECEGGTGAALIADPKFTDGPAGDYRIGRDSPCVDAGDAESAPESDYYGQTRAGAPDIGLYEVQLRETKVDVDLAAVTVSAAEKAAIGGNLTVTWSVKNVGSMAVADAWRDKLELIDVNGATVVLGTYTVTGGLAADGTRVFTGNFRVPSMSPGAARLRLKVNAERDVFEGSQTDNNVISAENTVQIALPSYTSDDYSKLTLASGTSMALSVAPEDGITALIIRGSAEVAVFGAAGYVPAGLRYDVAATRLADGSLLLSIPSSAAEGDFMFTVENGGASSATVEIETVKDALLISEITPMRASNAGDAYVTIRGVGLDTVASVRLEGSSTYSAQDLQAGSAPELTAQFNLNGASVGTYSVVVEAEDGTTARIGGFEIYKPKTGPKLEARLEIPSTVRQGRIYTGKIVYSNVGDEDMYAPFFRVVAKDATLRLDELADFNESELNVVGIATEYPAGVLRPGAVYELEFEFKSGSAPRFSLYEENDVTEDWKALAPKISQAATISNRRGRIVNDYGTLLDFARSIDERKDMAAACGSVIACDGSSVEGVSVYAEDVTGAIVATDTVDANGKFVLENLSSGSNYVIGVGSGAIAGALSIEMPTMGDLLDLCLNVRLQRELEVQFIGIPDGETASGVLRMSDGDGRQMAMVAFTGPVTIPYSSSNEYDVVYLDAELASGRRVLVASVVSPYDPQLGMSTVVDFSEAKLIRGTVRDGAGRPLSDGVVRLRNSDWSVVRNVMISQDGTYCIGGLDSGVYSLDVDSCGHRSGTCVVHLSEGDAVQDFEVDSVETASVKVAIPLVDSQGRLMVESVSGGHSCVFSVSNSTCEIQGLPLGKYEFYILDADGVLVSDVVKATVSEGLSEISLVSQSRDSSFVRIVDGDGNGVSGAVLVENEKGASEAFRSDADGLVQIDVNRGCHWVTVSASNCQPRASFVDLKGPSTIVATLSPLDDQADDDEDVFVDEGSVSAVSGLLSVDRPGVISFISSRKTELACAEFSPPKGPYEISEAPSDYQYVWHVDGSSTGVLKTRQEFEQAGNEIVVDASVLGEVDIDVFADIDRTMPVSGVTLTMVGGQSNTISQISDSTGRVHFRLTPDNYKVVASKAFVGCGEDIEIKVQGSGKVSASYIFPAAVDDSWLVAENAPLKSSRMSSKSKLSVSWNDVKQFGRNVATEAECFIPNAIATEIAMLSGCAGVYAAMASGMHREEPSLKCSHNMATWKEFRVARMRFDLALTNARYDAELMDNAYSRFCLMALYRLPNYVPAGGWAYGAATSLTEMISNIISNHKDDDILEHGKNVFDAKADNPYSERAALNYKKTVLKNETSAMQDRVKAIQRELNANKKLAVYERNALSQESKRLTVKISQNAPRLKEVNKQIGRISNRISRYSIGKEWKTQNATKLGKFATGVSIASDLAELYGIAAEVERYRSCLHADVRDLQAAYRRLEQAFRKPYHNPCGGNEPEVKPVDTENGGQIQPYVPPSRDPNEVAGPLGVGVKRYVKPGTWMDYTVYFENASDAEAAALDIYVTNPLSEWLDWSTFEMGDVSFNNQIDTNLKGAKNKSSEVPQNGTTYHVRSSVAFDEKKGVVSVELHILDHTTKYGVPEDPYAGILPPNDETHCGEGYFSYRVKVREDAPTGVQIDNSATIIFDYNDPIETDPAWWNTVGQVRKIVVSVDGVEREIELFEGEAFGELPDPGAGPAHCSFGGWFTGPNGTGTKVTAITLVSAEITTLYPLWLPNVAEVDGTEYEHFYEAVAQCPYDADEFSEITLLSDFEANDGISFEYPELSDDEVAEIKEYGHWTSETFVGYRHWQYLFGSGEDRVFGVSYRKEDWSFFTGQKVVVDLNGHCSSNAWIQVDCADVVIRDSSLEKTGVVSGDFASSLVDSGSLTLESGRLFLGNGGGGDAFGLNIKNQGNGEGGVFSFLGGEIVAKEGLAAVSVGSNCVVGIGGAAVATNAAGNVVLAAGSELNLASDFTGRVGITTDNDVEGAAIGLNPSGFAGAENFYCDSDPSLRGRTTDDGLIVWERVGQLEKSVGRHVSLDLVNALGIVIPEDVDYAAGDKVTVKVEGLAKGLKVVATPVYEDPNAKKKVIADYIYTIEGVPTEAIDFEQQPMYARVTVTYKDKTKGDKGKVETLQPIVLSIATPEPSVLTAGVLNQVYGPADIATLWPEVADAKTNPKEWSFKGWPAGLKYNATAKDASWSYKDGKSTVKATAAPYTVYGQPTKAGEYPITATWKHKLADGKTTVSETFSAVLTVWGDDGVSDFRAVSQAYVALTKNFGTGVTAMSGLPTGLKFTAKAVAATAKAPAQEAGDVYGTPTKPGVFAVTATLADKTKETFLWKVTEGENPGLDAAAIGWADAKVKFDGGTKKATILQGLEADFAVEASALAAGAKVTVSGLPSGLKYDAKTGKITGIATKAESKVVTVKVVQNGVTEVRTFAIDIVANPFAGTYYAYLTDGSARETATAVLTPAVGGSVKVVLDEYVPSLGKTVKTTVSAKGFTMLREYDPANPNAVQIAYDLELKANAKNNPDYASEVRALQLAFGLVKREEGLVVFIGQLVLKTGNDITCWGMAQKALTAAECAEVIDAIGFAPQSVLTGVFTDAGGGHLLYASAVLDEQKMQYKVTGKLGDGTMVKALLPIVYALREEAFYSAPCLLIEKGGAKRAYAMSFAHTKSDFVAKFWSHETAAAFQSCSAFDPEGIPATAAEQLGGESELVLDAAELAAAGFEGEAPAFRFVVNGADLAKAKLDVYAPDAKEGAKPLASLASAKLQASAGYVFKGSFKWDAKVGGDGNTYSFELVPSATDGKTFVGRCEVKPAKGMSVAVGAWTRIPMDI